MNSIINYVYEFGSGRGNFRKHIYVSIFSMNSLINYVYEFGSGRGKLVYMHYLYPCEPVVQPHLVSNLYLGGY